MADPTDFLDPTRERFREDLAKSVAQSERGRPRMKLKSFLEGFGYTASARVRQSSLASALENLRSWGYDHKLSGGTVNDYITIWQSSTPIAGDQPRPMSRTARSPTSSHGKAACSISQSIP